MSDDGRVLEGEVEKDTRIFFVVCLFACLSVCHVLLLQYKVVFFLYILRRQLTSTKEEENQW